MPRTNRLRRARRSIGNVDRLLLDLHGTVSGGDVASGREAWELIRDELMEVARSRGRLPEAWWRFEGPEDLRPFELPNGRTASIGDLPARRAAWLREHHAEVGL